MPVSRLVRVVAGRLIGAALFAGTFSHLSAFAQSVPAVCIGLNTAHTNAVTTGTLAPPLKRRWILTLDGRASAPLIVGGRVYVLFTAASGSGPLKLRSIDSISGATLWETTISSTERWGALAYDANTVVAQCGDGQLRAYDVANGVQKWSVSTNYSADAPPVARDGRVYVSAANALQCFAVDTGARIWSKSVRGSSRSAPAISDDGALYVSYGCPQVYKFNTSDGAQIWRYGTDSCSSGGGSTPSLYNGRLYVRESQPTQTSLRPGFVFDSATGADVGTINSHNLPAFSGNLSFTVFSGNSMGNGRLNAVSTDTGLESWNWTDGGNLSSPLVLNGRVYVGSSLGKLYALDPQSGALLWTTSIGAPVITSSDYANISPYTAMAAGEDLLVVPAQNKLAAFEAYPGTDTIAPTGYVTSPSGQGFLRAFPTSVVGEATDNPGGVGLDRVEMGIYRSTGVPGPVPGTFGREYFTGQSYSPNWTSTPKFFSSTLESTSWTLDSRYYDTYLDSGTYFLETVAYDRAGNSGTKTLTLRIDKTPPTATLTSPSRFTNSLSTLSGNVADNAGGSGVSSVKVSLLRDDNCGVYSDCGAYWNGSAWISTSQVSTPPLLNCAVNNGTWTCTSPLPLLASMPEKWYRVRPVATDFAGNATDLNLTFNTFSFWLDKTAPTLTFGAPTPAPNASGWNNVAVSIPYTTSDSTGIASATPGSPLVFSTSGRNRTQPVTVTDSAGNVATFVSPPVNVDLSAPVSTLSATGPHTTSPTAFSGPVSVALSANDLPASFAPSGVETTFYSLDNGATQTYTMPFSVEGFATHTLKFWSRDVAGNIEVAQSQTITIAPPNSAPIANSTSSDAGDEDTAQTLVLSASDADGDALTYSIVSQPAHGTLSGTAPNLTYTPTANYGGADSFTWKVSDGTLESTVATATLAVTPKNDAPSANNAAFSTDEDTTKVFTLTGSDVDGDALSFAVALPPAHGTLSGTAPELTYTPTANFSGADSFTFTASDSTLSAIGTITIAVAPINDAPTASAQTLETAEDTAKSLTLSGADIDGDALTFTITAPPTHGALSGTAPDLTYTPDANYNGSDSFSFKAKDAALESAAATVSLNISAKNDAPTTSNLAVVTDEDTVKNVTLPGSDVDGDALVFAITTPPTHGALSGTAPVLTYTPTANFSGSDSFAFSVNDGTLSANGTISVAVTAINDAPTSSAQSIQTAEDTAKNLVLSGADVDGDALTYHITVPPSHGTLSGTAPNLAYTPAANYNGADSFSFKVSDGTFESDATLVSLSISPVNDAPIAASQSVSTDEDAAQTLTLTGSDVDGDVLSFSVATPPSHGTLSGTAPNLIYTPDANYNGGDSFTFKAKDGALYSAPATVLIAIKAVSDAPVAVSDVYDATEDQTLVIAAPGVLGNDFDVDGDALSAVLSQNAAHGSVSLSANGSVSYIPDANYNGTDSFKYRVRDGAIDSAAVTVTLRVASVNDAPVALAQGVDTAEDVPKTIILSGADIEGDTLSYTVTTQPTHGTLSGTAPNLLYTPGADYNGSDSFAFKVKDGALDSTAATISVRVSAVNDAPTAASQTVSAVEDTAKNLVLSGADVDGDVLTYTIPTPPSHGTLSGTAPNLTYSPAANYNGTDSFAFKVSDGTLVSAPATISISVSPVNDAPLALNSTVTTLEDTAKIIALSASDVDGDALTYSIVTPPTKGTLSGSGASRTYTPSPDANGTDSLVWRAADAVSGANATVLLSITPVNDAPTASAQSVSTPQNTAKAITLAGADVDGDALTYVIVANPTKGTLSGSGAARTYTPNSAYSGADSFTFKTRDPAGLESSVVTVSLTVTPIVAIPPIEINYVITSQWNNGFTADIQIKNNGPALNGWTLTWNFAGNQQITNLWRGVVTQSGQSVTVKDATYNKQIATGATETIGFQATYSGTNAKPTAFKLNGVATAVK